MDQTMNIDDYGLMQSGTTTAHTCIEMELSISM